MSKLIVGLLLVGIAVLMTYHYKNSATSIIGVFGDKTYRQVAGFNDKPAYFYEVLAAPGQEFPLIPVNSTKGVFKTTVLVEFNRPLKLNSSVSIGTDFPLAGVPKVEKLVAVTNTSGGKKEYLYEVSLLVSLPSLQNRTGNKVSGFIGGHFVYLKLAKGYADESSTVLPAETLSFVAPEYHKYELEVWEGAPSDFNSPNSISYENSVMNHYTHNETVIVVSNTSKTLVNSTVSNINYGVGEKIALSKIGIGGTITVHFADAYNKKFTIVVIDTDYVSISGTGKDIFEQTYDISNYDTVTVRLGVFHPKYTGIDGKEYNSPLSISGDTPINSYFLTQFTITLSKS